MSEEEGPRNGHDYDWHCRKCGKEGTNCGDEIWKFCPYCGNPDLEIKEIGPTCP